VVGVCEMFPAIVLRLVVNVVIRLGVSIRGSRAGNQLQVITLRLVTVRWVALKCERSVCPVMRRMAGNCCARFGDATWSWVLLVCGR
jgi:hypothetical protein